MLNTRYTHIASTTVQQSKQAKDNSTLPVYRCYWFRSSEVEVFVSVLFRWSIIRCLKPHESTNLHFIFLHDTEHTNQSPNWLTSVKLIITYYCRENQSAEIITQPLLLIRNRTLSHQALPPLVLIKQSHLTINNTTHVLNHTHTFASSAVQNRRLPCVTLLNLYMHPAESALLPDDTHTYTLVKLWIFCN